MTRATNGKYKKYIDFSRLSPTPEIYPRTPQYVEYGYIESINRDQQLFNVFLTLAGGFLGAMITSFQWWMVPNTVIFSLLFIFFSCRINKTKKDMLNPDKMIKLNGNTSGRPNI